MTACSVKSAKGGAFICSGSGGAGARIRYLVGWIKNQWDNTNLFILFIYLLGWGGGRGRKRGGLAILVFSAELALLISV